MTDHAQTARAIVDAIVAGHGNEVWLGSGYYADELLVSAIADALARVEEGNAIREAFTAGWRHGYYDGGEHDCRMFTPTADRAWDDYQRESKEAQ